MDEKIIENRVIPRLDFKDIIGLNVRFLYVFGNIAPEYRTKAWTALYAIYATLFVGFIYGATLISEVTNMIMVLGDLEQMAEAAFLTLTHLVQLIKLYAIYRYSDKLKNLITRIDSKEFLPKTMGQYQTLQNYINDSKVITKIFLSACVVTCSFWTAYPFTVEGTLTLPLAGWFPFDTSESPNFEIAFVYQAVTSTINGLSNICIDTLMAGIIYIGMLTSEIINMFVVFGDLDKMANGCFLTLTHLIQVNKLYYMFKYRKQLKLLINNIGRREFQPRSLQQCCTLQSYVRQSKVITVTFLSAGLLTCCFWGLYPFTEGGELFLPLEGWYPFDTGSSPAFEMTFVFQFVGAIVNALSNISLDTLMSGLIMVICAQLTILNDSLKNIRKYTEEGLEKDKFVDEKITDELQRKMDEKLVECIVHHRYILQFSNDLTFLFTNSILGQFVVSVIIICITLLEITLVPLVSLKFFSLILYQFCMLLEIFLLCYYGNEVIIQSMKLTKCAYFSDWTGCSPKFKKNLIFFMTRSQVSLKLYAGGFFTLSLETFVKILKSSWSYFAVLNSVRTRDT